MIDDFRDCPGCGSQREFVQLHPGPGRCPDSPDGRCPESCCSACGTALLEGPQPGRSGLIAASSRPAAGQLDRVA
jgi:hypothetical protein